MIEIDKTVQRVPEDPILLCEPSAAQHPGSGDNRHFRIGHLLADLKGSSVRGVAVTMADKGTNFSLKLAPAMVLARPLTPGDLGLFTRVGALTGFIELFTDAGLSIATIQREHITQAQASTLFWINVALSGAPNPDSLTDPY